MAARFSRRWEQCLDRNAQGHVFLDFDPYCFQQLMAYLRARGIHGTLGQSTPYPSIDTQKQHDNHGLIRYLALEDYMGYSRARFDTCNRGMQYSQDNQSVEYASLNNGPGEKDVHADLSMLAGETHYYKLRIKHLRKSDLFLGISRRASLAQKETCLASSVYGWSNSHCQWFDKGTPRECSLLQWQTGDCLLLKVDLQKFCMTLTSSLCKSPSSKENEHPK